MILANVNIGSGPSAGDGDPLRTAFSIINDNFTILQGNVTNLSNGVSKVANRTGNVVLTVNDIVGFRGLSISNASAPTHSNSSGITGTVITSGNYLYLCVAPDTWIRSSITTSF